MPDTRKPNVVLILADQQRWDMVGTYGCPLDLTPNFDRLAAQGTLVVNAFTAQPVWDAARAVLQTGQYATRVNCWKSGMALPAEFIKLETVLGDAGYQTDFFDLACPLGGSSPADSDSGLSDGVIRCIDRHQAVPFFLFLSSRIENFNGLKDGDPDNEFDTNRYTGRWVPLDLADVDSSIVRQLPEYYDGVRHCDAVLGQLLSVLKDFNLTDHTIILVTSARGINFLKRGSQYREAGCDSSIRIPMAIQGPGFMGSNQINHLVSLMDVAPTLLDACGIERPDDMQGQSFLPLVSKKSFFWQDDIFVQISESQVGRVIRTKRWKYHIVAPGKNGIKHAGSDRYIEEALYDLQTDPYELVNLIHEEAFRPVSKVMRERMLRRMSEAGEKLPTIMEAEIKPSLQRTLSAFELLQ